MKIEIEQYITNHYYELLAICRKYTDKDSFSKNNSEDWASELLHFVILQLYDKNEIKLKSLDDNSIKYYIVSIINTNWIHKSSPFFRKYKKDRFVNMDSMEYKNLVDEDIEHNPHKVLQIIEETWSELDWFNKIIFEKYMVLGSLKKVSMDTTIPIASIKRYVDNTKRLIKEHTNNKLNQDE